MPLETELKLQIDPRHIARLRGHPLFKHATRRASRKLHSVITTPDLDLWRAGVTLRLRRTSGQWVQTIKGGGTVAAGLHQRHEFETALTTPVPDFSAIGGELAAHFASSQLRARLKPMIVTEFTRFSSLLAPAPGVAIEASIDRGIIKCGAATEPICELELEVKTGPAWRAYQLAMQLLEAVPLLVEDRSKAERGVARRLSTRYEPLKAPPSPVAADMTSNSAFKALVQMCLAHYTANARYGRRGPNTCTRCEWRCGGCAPCSARSRRCFRLPFWNPRWRKPAGSRGSWGRRATGMCSSRKLCRRSARAMHNIAAWRH